MARPQRTSKLRPLAGLDQRGRQALIRALGDAGASAKSMVVRFLREEAYADLRDYMEAVAETFGSDAETDLREAIESVVSERVDETDLDFEGARRAAFERWSPYALLLAMPEGDFLSALEIGATLATDVMEVASLPQYLDRVCRQRGIPYEVTGVGGQITFVWHGDPTISEAAIAPAQGALADSRLAGGPASEFHTAQRELRTGTPHALKQSVAESCSAVESTMRVLLEAHGSQEPSPATAKRLFHALVGGGLLDVSTEGIVLSASRFGNARGRHGAGSAPHDVSVEEAGAVLAAAATAIVLLAGRLP